MHKPPGSPPTVSEITTDNTDLLIASDATPSLDAVYILAADGTLLPYPQPVSGENQPSGKLEAIFPSPVASRLRELIQQVLKDNRPQTLSFQLPPLSEPEYRETVISPWHDGQALLMVFNINCRQRYLASLQMQIDYLHLATDHLLYKFIETDLDGIYRYIGTSSPVSGYLPSDLLGKNCFDFIHPDDQRQVRDAFNRVLALGHYGPTEYRYRHADGSYVWLETVGSLIYSQEGDPSRVLLGSRDITERKQAEEALRRSERRYRALFDTMQEGFALGKIIYDDQGNPCDLLLVDINPAFEKIVGQPREALIGRQVLQIAPDLEPYWIEICGRVAVSGQPAQMQNYMKLVNKYFEVMVFTPEEQYVACLWLDMTEHRKLERKMVHLARLQVVGEMAAGIAHEIRNPMTSVRGFLQMMGEDPEMVARYQPYFDLMIDELDQADAIITEFLALTKSRSLDMRRQNLNDIVRTLLPQIEAEATKSGNMVDSHLAEIPDLLLDGKQVRQLILNLARNGLEAMPGAGTLTISTWQEPNGVVLAIRDQGSGIDPDILEKIGTPFVTTKDQGTGLGLMVCYGIATRHNAHINVETGSRGTTFYVHFNP